VKPLGAGELVQLVAAPHGAGHGEDRRRRDDNRQ